MTSAPGALILFGGVGLAYWAVFGDKGLLKHSPNRQALVNSIIRQEQGGVTIPPGGGTGGGTTPPVDGVPIAVTHFANAIAHFETGGGPQSYYRTQHGQAPSAEALLNAKGAFGKYQFLPGTWRTLSKHYYGRVVAPTPQAQEYVAQHQFERLHNGLGSWALVAVAWRSGRGWTGRPVGTWSLGLVRYVNSVNCYLKSQYGEGWDMISLVGHTDRKGNTYNNTADPFGPFSNCGGAN